MYEMAKLGMVSPPISARYLIGHKNTQMILRSTCKMGFVLLSALCALFLLERIQAVSLSDKINEIINPNVEVSLSDMVIVMLKDLFEEENDVIRYVVSIVLVISGLLVGLMGRPLLRLSIFFVSIFGCILPMLQIFSAVWPKGKFITHTTEDRVFKFDGNIIAVIAGIVLGIILGCIAWCSIKMAIVILCTLGGYFIGNVVKSAVTVDADNWVFIVASVVPTVVGGLLGYLFMNVAFIIISSFVGSFVVGIAIQMFSGNLDNLVRLFSSILNTRFSIINDAFKNDEEFKTSVYITLGIFAFFLVIQISAFANIKRRERCCAYKF